MWWIYNAAETYVSKYWQHCICCRSDFYCCSAKICTCLDKLLDGMTFAYHKPSFPIISSCGLACIPIYWISKIKVHVIQHFTETVFDILHGFYFLTFKISLQFEYQVLTKLFFKNNHHFSLFLCSLCFLPNGLTSLAMGKLTEVL